MKPRPVGYLALVGLLLLAGGVAAEIYVPPTNVIDPAAKAKEREASDETLPYLYLEPHDVSFDRDRPPRVTVYAVNRGGRRPSTGTPSSPA